MERSRFFDAMDPIQWQWHCKPLRILVRTAAGEVLSFSLCTAPWVIESASAAQPAAAAGEHDASDKTFRPPDGDKFYITTAINYTNGRAPPTHSREDASSSTSTVPQTPEHSGVRGESPSAPPILLCASALACRAAAHGPCVRGRHHRCPRKIPSDLRPAGPQQRWHSSVGRRSGYSASCTFGVGLVRARAVRRCVRRQSTRRRAAGLCRRSLRRLRVGAAVCRDSDATGHGATLAPTVRSTVVYVVLCCVGLLSHGDRRTRREDRHQCRELEAPPSALCLRSALRLCDCAVCSGGRRNGRTKADRHGNEKRGSHDPRSRVTVAAGGPTCTKL